MFVVRPVDARYPVTLGYRQKARFDPNYIHRGIDYGCPSGTPVVATAAGVVVGGSYGSAYGVHVIVRVGNIWCLYGHLSRKSVVVGQKVAAGQQVGLSGATGNVRGAHLHYQECTRPPSDYRSDRAPLFISGAPVAAKPTVFDVCWWSQAATRYFGKPWLPRVPGIGKELRGEASVYGFSELYDESTATDILKQLNLEGAKFRRSSPAGRVGLELMYDTTKWVQGREAKNYASGVQNRFAYVVHLTRVETGQHVAFVLVHGPVFDNALKAAYGRWFRRLLGQIDGPVVVLGDVNRPSNSNPPRSDIQAAGFRTVEQQCSMQNESADEFPDKGDLADIWTKPGEAPIIAGALDYTSSKLSDHRRIEATVRIPAPKGEAPPPKAGLPLELSKYKRTLPAGEKDHPTEQHPLVDTEGPVVFRAPVDGVTTKNSSYPRDELREYEAAWSNESEPHVQQGSCAVTELPGKKPHVVVAQIHDATDDVLMLRVEGSTVFAEWSKGKGQGSVKVPLFSGYNLGDRLDYEIRAGDGAVSVTVNGIGDKKMRAVVGGYFKAGCYTQANESNGTGAGEVVYYALKESH